MFENLFSQRGLSMDRLRTLVEVAEAGGISKAVDGDPVRQSQYSRQLKELEEFFGTTLTKRVGKGLVLTPAGTRLASLVLEHFKGLGEFTSSCRQERVVFDIGAGDSLIRWVLLPVLPALQKALPDIGVTFFNMRTSDAIRALQELRLDFACVRKDAIPSDLASRSLGSMGYALFVPKGLAQQMPPHRGDLQKKLARNETLGILGQVPLAILHGDGELVKGLQALASDSGVKLDVRLRCESLPMACRAVALGSYAAVLPLFCKAELPADVRVVASPAFKALERTIHLVWNPRILRLRPVAAKVLAQLQKTIKLG